MSRRREWRRHDSQGSIFAKRHSPPTLRFFGLLRTIIIIAIVRCRLIRRDFWPVGERTSRRANVWIKSYRKQIQSFEHEARHSFLFLLHSPFVFLSSQRHSLSQVKFIKLKYRKILFEKLKNEFAQLEGNCGHKRCHYDHGSNVGRNVSLFM